MIAFQGFDDLIKDIYKHKQEHIFEYWDELNIEEKKELLADITGIDLNLLNDLYRKAEKEALHPEFSPAPFIPLPASDDEISEYGKSREAGLRHIKQGRVAAFMVAGGQGTRLGFNGPKGKFPVGPVSGKTLFQIHSEKIFKSILKCKVQIPFLIMTSRANHRETLEFFEENNYFGLKKEDVRIFQQNMIPSLDTEGKLVLKTKNKIFKNPDGHGGSLSALKSSGALDFLKQRGIQTISYFQVDNPLVKIIDPVFIGFHVLGSLDMSCKALRKTNPEEKVGVFVKFADNTVGIVEYSDLPLEKQRIQDCSGNLLYNMGNPAIHLFDIDFVDRITSGEDLAIPYHTARKKIKAYRKGRHEEITGFKFEKFVFDALPLTSKNIIFETSREEEFAPVKNKTGADSADTSIELMSGLYRKWLMEKGVEIPETVDTIEISPLVAIEAGDLEGPIKIPDKDKVYIG